jgi:hypothetical protein
VHTASIDGVVVRPSQAHPSPFNVRETQKYIAIQKFLRLPCQIALPRRRSPVILNGQSK